jgi:hypothetical protein
VRTDQHADEQKADQRGHAEAMGQRHDRNRQPDNQREIAQYS